MVRKQRQRTAYMWIWRNTLDNAICGLCLIGGLEDDWTEAHSEQRWLDRRQRDRHVLSPVMVGHFLLPPWWYRERRSCVMGLIQHGSFHGNVGTVRRGTISN